MSEEEIDRKYRSFLATNGVITLPGPVRWGANGHLNPFGLLVTALLLSLGAPFWYSALGQLLPPSIRHRREGRCAADGAAIGGSAISERGGPAAYTLYVVSAFRRTVITVRLKSV